MISDELMMIKWIIMRESVKALIKLRHMDKPITRPFLTENRA